MSPNEFEDAKTLWKMFYASECFQRAKNAATHIRDERMEIENPLFYPLLTSVYVLYSKPFKRSDGVGRLDEAIVPKASITLHRKIVADRDTVYAHRDADVGGLPEFGELSQVRVLVRHDMRLIATDFHSRYTLMPEVIVLCSKLKEKADFHVDKIFKRYQRRVPNREGEYAINVWDEAGDFFLRRKPMFNGTVSLDRHV